MLTSSYSAEQASLLEAFEVKSLDEPVLEALLALASSLSVSYLDLFYKWESFSSMEKCPEIPKIEHMANFKAWLVKQQSTAAPQSASQRPPDALTVKAPTSSSLMGGGLKKKMLHSSHLDAMLPSKSLPSQQATPHKPSAPAKSLDLLSSPTFGASAFSPGQAKRDVQTPAFPAKSELALHFSDRNQKGKREMVYNDHISKPSFGLEQPEPLHATVSIIPGQQTSGYRYMINTFARIISKSIRELEKETLQDGATEGEPDQYLMVFAHPAMASQEPQYFIGKISCDSLQEGVRLNLHSLLLETSKEIGAGARVAIDLSQIVSDGKALNLFPGQIMAVKATNPTGACLVVSQVLPIPSLDAPVSNGDEYLAHYPEGRSRHLSLVVASGPYALNDSLEYEPLEELISSVERDAPNVLILSGPFVDIDHPMFQPSALTEVDLTFEEVFRYKIVPKLEKMKKVLPHLEIVLIPSQRDATLEWVAYPQPPLGSAIKDDAHILKLQSLGLLSKNGTLLAHLFPNPVQFTCNEVVIAVSNLDTIKDLVLYGLSMTPSNHQETNGKFTSSFVSILEQRHFYPVFPPSAGACLDSTRALASQPSDPCVLQVKPDILITPSRLQYTIKNVDGCVCINPGYLAKGRTGGTFCSVVVHPLSSEGMTVDDVFEHAIADRARVEIIHV
ncbi:DNA-directed DNA polymerase alpha subunit pol12 [Kappamyces sp. JEL0829]|nr:DNA-directed DNA polymerase alpha subunit pol12 [Kappamyces sp. JEL0829]